MRRLILIAGIILLTAGRAWGAVPFSDIHHLIHERWTEEHDLPVGGLYTLFQDRHGLIWIGSSSGLFSFDGVSAQRAAPEEIDESVFAMAEDDEGNLWLATGTGLVKLTPGGTVRRFGLAAGLGTERVRDVVMWAGHPLVATGRGMWWLQGGRFSSFPDTGTGSTKVYALCPYRNGALFLGTSIGLGRVQGGRLELPLVDSARTGEVYALDQGPDGALWIGAEKGLFMWRENHLTRISCPDVIGKDLVAPLMVDGQGTVWFGVGSRGVARYDGEHEDLYTEADGLTSNRVFSFLLDREGSVWMGTYGGLDQFRSGSFTVYGSRDGIPHEVIEPVIGLPDGRVAAGTQDGLAVFDGTSHFRSYFRGRVISSLAVLPDGDLLVAASRRTVYRFHEGTVEPERALQSLDGRFIAVMRLVAGSLWIGTDRGLFRQRKGRIQRFGRLEDLVTQVVRDVLPEDEDSVWIATDDGVSRITGQSVWVPGPESGLPRGFVYSLYRDREGVFWVCSERGLYRWNRSRFVKIGSDQGFPGRAVYGMLEDAVGRIWISHDAGLSVVTGDMLRNAGSGALIQPRFRTFGMASGLRTRGGLGGTQPCITMDHEGRIWIPTVRGLAMLDPDRVVTNAVPPPVRIRSIQVDGHQVPLPESKAIVLPPGWKRISIRYAGLSYVHPQSVRYRILLSGYDDHWQEVANRHVSYTNLDPGEYTFMVHACNNDGLWSRKPAVLRIQVVTPWWRTWWFLALMLVAVSVLGNLGYRGLRQVARMFAQWKGTHVFGKFRIVEEIGKGGMGTVYKAEHTGTGETVALKVLDADLTDEAARKRFEREGMIGERIDHPNVVRIFESGSQGRKLFYTMEFLRGRTLDTYCEQGMGVRTALAVTRIVLDVLDELHGSGIIHRDIKPRNIMILSEANMARIEDDPDPVSALRPHIKLLDFGLARLFGATTLTRTGLMAGTVHYSPPESLGGHREIGPEIDTYAVGVMLYEMITGLPPYGGEDVAEVVYAILYRTVTPPNEVVPRVPKGVSDLTMMMIDKAPDSRLTDISKIRHTISLLLAAPREGIRRNE